MMTDAAVGQSCRNANTQLEMNQCFGAAYKSADGEMNAVYQQVLQAYSGDRKFIENLKASQRAWVAFRDAEMEAVYPSSNKQAEYGSVYPVCRSKQLETLTRERTKQLQVWLNGVEEGDVCAGSVKTREQLRGSTKRR